MNLGKNYFVYLMVHLTLNEVTCVEGNGKFSVSQKSILFLEAKQMEAGRIFERNNRFPLVKTPRMFAIMPDRPVRDQRD